MSGKRTESEGLVQRIEIPYKFLPSESVTSEEGTALWDDQWKIHSACKVKEEHAMKQITVPNWFHSVKQPVEEENKLRETVQQDLFYPRNVLPGENVSEKEFSCEESIEELTKSRGETECSPAVAKSLPLPNQTIVKYPSLPPVRSLTNSNIEKGNFLNNLQKSVASYKVTSSPKTDLTAHQRLLDTDGQKHRRKSDQTRQVVPYKKYLSLMEETEMGPLDLLPPSNNSSPQVSAVNSFNENYEQSNSFLCHFSDHVTPLPSPFPSTYTKPPQYSVVHNQESQSEHGRHEQQGTNSSSHSQVAQPCYSNTFGSDYPLPSKENFRIVLQSLMKPNTSVLESPNWNAASSMSSSDTDEEALAVVLISKKNKKPALISRKKKKVQCRRFWVKESLKQREKEGEYHTLLKELESDEQRYWRYFKMTKEDFQEILQLIYKDIIRVRTCLRKPISPAERLAVCLRFLNTGDTFRTIAFSFRMGEQTVSSIVEEVCIAICQRLQPIFMPQSTEDIFSASAEQFKLKWQYPNCIAAIDGKHVIIKCTPRNSSRDFNYKKTLSTVLLALVDPNYVFLAVDVGAYRGNSDAGILQNSAIGKHLSNGTLHVPGPKTLPGGNMPMPHVILGDEAFSLTSYMMRPFPKFVSKGDPEKRIYNYRHCQARRVVKNAFGILVQKYRVFQRPLGIKRETAVSVIKATCCLHNFLRKKLVERNTDHRVEPEEEEMWHEELRGAGALQDLAPTNVRANREALGIRNNFATYFASENGSVP